MDKDNKIYNILRNSETSYTNHAQVKLIFYNLIYFFDKVYPEEYKKHINNY